MFGTGFGAGVVTMGCTTGAGVATGAAVGTYRDGCAALTDRNSEGRASHVITATPLSTATAPTTTIHKSDIGSHLASTHVWATRLGI
jgi:hypothetical protein